MRRLSLPTFGGKLIRESTMPKKSVVQYTCERCARVWYLDAAAPEPAAKLVLKADGFKEKLADVHYECLCDSCSDTVKSLIDSLAPLKPRERRAKKKDEGSGQGNSPATTPDAVTKDEAPAQPGASLSSAPGPSSVGASSGAGGRPPAPSTAVHPRR